MRELFFDKQSRHLSAQRQTPVENPHGVVTARPNQQAQLLCNSVADTIHIDRDEVRRTMLNQDLKCDLGRLYYITSLYDEWFDWDSTLAYKIYAGALASLLVGDSRGVAAMDKGVITQVLQEHRNLDVLPVCLTNNESTISDSACGKLVNINANACTDKWGELQVEMVSGGMVVLELCLNAVHAIFRDDIGQQVSFTTSVHVDSGFYYNVKPADRGDTYCVIWRMLARYLLCLHCGVIIADPNGEETFTSPLITNALQAIPGTAVCRNFSDIDFAVSNLTHTMH